MGSNNSRGRSTSLPHPAVGGGGRHQRSRDSEARERRTLKRLSSAKHASAAASTVGARTASAYGATPSSLAANTLSNSRQHRDAAAGAVTVSSVTQGSRLASPVSPTHQPGRHSLSSLSTPHMRPSPPHAGVVASTGFYHALGDMGHSTSDLSKRERAYGAELSQQQQQNAGLNVVVSSTRHSCQAHDDEDNVDSGGSRSGSVMGTRCTRSSSILQAVSDTAVPLPLRTLLSLEDAHSTANDAGTAPTLTSVHIRGAVSGARGDDTEVGVGEHNAASSSSQVSRAVSRSTSIPKSGVQPGSPSLSCSPSPAETPLPLPFGRAAPSTSVPRSPSAGISTVASQWPDERPDEDIKGVVKRGSSKDEAGRESKAEFPSDSSSSSSGFWRGQSRSMFRKLLSRRDSYAESSPSPSRPEAGQEGGGARCSNVKCTAENHPDRSDVFAATIMRKRTSPAPRADDLPPPAPPSTTSAALGAKQRSSTESASLPAGASAAAAVTELPASTLPISSMTAPRALTYEAPHAEVRADRRIWVVLEECEACSPSSGLTSHDAADRVPKRRPSEKECTEALHREMRGCEGTPVSLNFVAEAPTTPRDNEESDSTTSTDTNLAPILPPPPTASFAEAVWGTQGATPPASATAVTHNTTLFSDYDRDYDNDDDRAAAGTAFASPMYDSQQSRRGTAPGVLSTTTVTDTTARVSPRSPSVSPLTAVAAAAFPSSAAAVARVKGRRSVSQSAIIAAWNRMGARSGVTVSGVSAGGGHHGGGGNPEASTETLQIGSASGKSLAIAGGGIGAGDDDLTASAAPASRDAQIARLTIDVATEAATGEAPPPSRQLTVADDRGCSHRSRANIAVVLPVRRRSVVTRQRGPPPIFSPSPDHSKLSDAAPTRAPGETIAHHAAPATQGLQRPPALPAEEEAEERFLVRVPPLRRELPADLHAPTTASPPAIATQWSSPPESRESDVSISTGHLLQEHALVSADFEDSSRGGLVGEQVQLPVYDTTVYDEEIASATATTVDADEDDRGNEVGAVERRATERSLHSLTRHQHRRQLIDVPPRRAFAPGFTTTHTAVSAINAATDLLPANSYNKQYGSQPRLIVNSSALAPNTNAASLFGVFTWAQSSLSSPRSYSASDSRLGMVTGAENAEEEDNIDEAGLRRARDGDVAYGPLHRPENERVKPFAGLDVVSLNQRLPSPPAHCSRSGSFGFNAMTTANLSGGGSHRTALVRSNSYQSPRRHSQRALVRSTSSLPSTRRLMPPWRERSTPTPQPTSPFSSSATRDDVGGVAGGLPSTPLRRRGLTSQGAPPFAHQPSAHLHQSPPPLMPTATSRMPQHLHRETSESLGSMQWQEVSLRPSGGRSSPNSGFAESSRDNDDTPPCYGSLEDEEGHPGATVNEDEIQGDGEDGAPRHHGRPRNIAVGDDAGDDGDETFLCWESSGAPTWGLSTWRTWQRGDEDDEDGYEEEEDKGDASENEAGSCSNGDGHSVDRRRLQLPQRRHRCRAASPPTVTAQLATPQQKQHKPDHLGSASRGFGTSALSGKGISHSSVRPRTFGDTIGCLPQTRYEPPMLSNRNTFTAFVPLADISSSQLLATAAAFQCGLGAHLRCASPGVHSSEAAAAPSGDDCNSVSQAGPCVDTPVTADTRILNGYALQDAYLTDGADVRVDIVSLAGGELPISPLFSSVSTAPTNHISRFNTPVPLAVHSAEGRRASRSEETEATRTGCVSPGALSGSTPPKSRSVTKAPPGMNDVSAAAAVEHYGNEDGSDGGSDDLSAPGAHPAATSQRTSWSLESVRVAAVPVSEGERHTLSDEERPGLDAFMRSPSSLHSGADAAVAMSARTSVDASLPQSAQFSASQSLSGKYSPPQPWWNRHRCITQSEGSGTLDLSQRGGESSYGGGGHPSFSPRSAHCAPAVVSSGRAASPAFPAGSAAIAESSPGHTSLLGGGAVAPLALKRSSGRLRREMQYSKTLTNDRRGSALRRSSSSASNEGGNVARSGVAGAASRGGSNGETLMKQVRCYDVEDADEERVAEIKASAAPAAQQAGHDCDGNDVGPTGACAPARTWQHWMPIVSLSTHSAAATAAEMACAEAESDGELTVTVPTHVMTTATVVPLTASFVEGVEGQLAGDASPHALAVVAASSEPCHDAEGAKPDKEALGDRGDGAERSEVAVAVLLSRGVQMHCGGLGSTPATLTGTALPSTLDSLQETEAYARTCIEESLADVREAWMVVWGALQRQHELLLLQQQSALTTAPFGLPFALYGMGLVEGSASAAIGSVAGAADNGGGTSAAMSTSTSLHQLTSTKNATVMACPEKVVPPLFVVLAGCAASTAATTMAATGGADLHSVSGSDAACGTGADRGEVATPTAAVTMTSRKSCGSLLSPSPESELLLMPRHGGDGGSGPGPSLALMDESVVGVMKMDSSASGAEVASALSCDDTHSISAAVAASGACGGAEVTVPPLVLIGSLNACAVPTTGTGAAAALSLVAPCLEEVASGSSGANEAHGVDLWNGHDGRIGADAGVEGKYDPPRPSLTKDPLGAHSAEPPLTTSHCVADSSSVGLAVQVEQLDNSFGEQTPLTIQQSSPEPTQPITLGTAGTPVSPTSASVRSLLRLKEGTALGMRAASRGQVHSNSADGLMMSPALQDDDSTTPVRARSRPQRQHRGPSAGQVVCRWCGEPYTSTDVCLVARRLHSVLREERRIEKTAKRTAQMLLCEGRVTEAVELLKSAGVYAL